MVRKSREDWKIYKNVFDNFTNRVLFKLQGQKIIDELKSPVEIGKESNVFTASSPNGTVIVKIYRLESCNFNKMYEYIRQDNRYMDMKKSRRDTIFAWVQREYRNLMKSREAGVRVPAPLAVNNNVIVLSMIGDETPSPQLKDDYPEDPETYFEELKKQLRTLYKADLVHGDLSEFNILNYRNQPVLIDFSQSTTTSSPNAMELLQRDIGNLRRFFKKLKLDVDIEETIKFIVD